MALPTWPQFHQSEWSPLPYSVLSCISLCGQCVDSHSSIHGSLCLVENAIGAPCFRLTSGTSLSEGDSVPTTHRMSTHSVLFSIQNASLPELQKKGRLPQPHKLPRCSGTWDPSIMKHIQHFKTASCPHTVHPSASLFSCIVSIYIPHLRSERI